jgi:universal stress protein E
MKRFKNILFVTSPTGDNKVSFQRAADLAAHNQARLTVMNVPEGIPIRATFHMAGDASSKIIDGVIAHYRKQLDELSVTSQQNIEIRNKVVPGTPFLEIIRAVLHDGHDLVIKTPQPQHGLQELLFGSTDMHLLRKCPCPVWMIKSDELPPYRRILAAIDLESSDDDTRRDDLNLQILEMASSLALSEPGELHIVNAWQAVGESLVTMNLDLDRDELNTWLKDQKRAFENELQTFMTALPKIIGQEGAEYIAPQVHLIQGSAEKVIPQLAKEKQMDLIVMGTVARTGLTGFFMGNIAESILNQINCSVLALKPSGFCTPVTSE